MVKNKNKKSQKKILSYIFPGLELGWVKSLQGDHRVKLGERGGGGVGQSPLHQHSFLTALKIEDFECQNLQIQLKELNCST